jgi:hypothetical protein
MALLVAIPSAIIQKALNAVSDVQVSLLAGAYRLTLTINTIFDFVAALDDKNTVIWAGATLGRGALVQRLSVPMMDYPNPDAMAWAELSALGP